MDLPKVKFGKSLFYGKWVCAVKHELSNEFVEFRVLDTCLFVTTVFLRAKQNNNLTKDECVN